MQTIAQQAATHNGVTALDLYTAPLAPTFPEMPCSINLLVDVPGYANRAQCTGRGYTGEEAARNLKANVDALTAAFAPVPKAPAPLASRLDRLGALLACGTAKAMASNNTARLERLTRAYLLVVKGMVEAVTMNGVPTGAYEVQSQTTAGTQYFVEGQSCECQDARRHAEEKDWWCQHSLAALYTFKLDAQEATV